MNHLLRTSGILGIISALILAGCSKIQPEITTLDVDRLFSPINLETRVINKTSLRLSWKQVAKAASYDVELFANGDLDFSGTPERTIADVTFDQLPLEITGLDGETQYSVRVRAVGAEISNSKWVSATFTTDAEQIFQQVDVSDLEATAVTLRWTAGATVTQLLLSPGNIARDITAEEIEKGAAEVTGLTGETAYTAKIMNGSKLRGTVSFTTLIDLGGATQVNPGDDLEAIIGAAAEGDVLALMPGEYLIPSLNVVKSVSIKGARPAEKPVLKSTILHVKNGVSLALKDLVLDGTGSDGNQAIVFDEDGTNTSLSVDHCDIMNYTKGVMYVNKATLLDMVVFTNNIIHDIECNGGDFIDFRNGLAKSFTFTDNTVYNSALARDLFRMDAGGSSNFPGITSTITISNNTFNKISDGSNRRVLYIRLANQEITFTKNILANTQGYYTNQSSTKLKTMADNNYFNAPNFTESTTSGSQIDTGTFTTFDPGFANEANGDFTLGNEELKFKQIGDRRWIK